MTAAIASIEEDAWQAIKYPNAIWEADDTVPGGGYWVSDAEAAEVRFTAFTGRRKAEHVTCRLIVRRVKQAAPAVGVRWHRAGRAVRDLPPPRLHHQQHPQPDRGRSAAPRPRDRRAGHRRAEGQRARAPDGKSTANAAWVACAVIAFNLARAAAVAAGLAKARWASLRSKIIRVPGRIASTARRLDLHLPIRWPWAEGWQSLHVVATGPPISVMSQPTEITDHQSPLVDPG